ncbi:Carbonate dehydratase [Chloroherpeton thalassium ATCC 35110]|uniref:Carbonic anhydrase n=1 Tax=Chloroherpeton thalassium (strain ATCC 35110 / GB-78) TaxID=517418 RepID=B3QZD0_CHLT3|nr:carbonate dehydratase [Chloroherpeton thalassium]ACF13823.1 Carbonate dehydratase [Chloroherpeton thalassium ATCC 35110]
MRTLHELFENNKRWAKSITERDPEFFPTLSKQQAPKYLWIGCSDSRVPANEIVGLMPGELFVHRNVANMVIHTDLNCLSVIQYAVDVLQVEHIMVCGHYGCGGIMAAMQYSSHGLIDNWLRHVQDVIRKHSSVLNTITDGKEKLDKLCELNVVEQVINVCQTTIVESAWARGQKLSIHGWLYGLSDGLLHDLSICITGTDEIDDISQAALSRLTKAYTK